MATETAIRARLRELDETIVPMAERMVNAFRIERTDLRAQLAALESSTKGEPMFTDEDLKTRFTYHAPQGTAPERFITIRDTAHTYAQIINQLCPNGREKSLALTHLEEVVMWANAAIARNPEGAP